MKVTRWRPLIWMVMVILTATCSSDDDRRATGGLPGARSGGPARPSTTEGTSAARTGALASAGGRSTNAGGGSSRVLSSSARAEAGPDCRAASAGDQYREGPGHDHRDVSLHRISCGVEQVAFVSLVDQLSDEVLGEMDVKADVAAVAVTYPQAGVLFFDVADPARPRLLSRYRSSECEGQVIDVNCGAFVDLSADGKRAYLSIQQTTVVPGRVPDPQAPAPAVPGVELIDLREPRNPKLADVLAVPSEGGVHTSRSHVIPEGFADDAVAGEYLFSVANGLGVAVARVEQDPLGGPRLAFVKLIPVDEVHDTFIQNDPIDRRTYLYVAAGFESGFYVFDVTDPGGATPLKAEWDLTPECERDWYAHTIDVTTRGSKRYVTMPAELFEMGDQRDEDQADGCGHVVGNGDKPGPLWIVDASDLTRLGPADAADGAGEEAATEAELKTRSAAALVTTWTNAAGRPGGNLIFSPHNQQIVGNRIYLSGYHSGVTILDASAAFAGQHTSPREIGFVVPSGSETRPLYSQSVPPAVPFFGRFASGRPLVWDQVFYKGHILTADMVGGFYSFSPPP